MGRNRIKSAVRVPFAGPSPLEGEEENLSRNRFEKDYRDEAVYRVLDANLNRAREGIRVLEDTARFVWKKEKIFQDLRRLRHGLDKVTRAAYPRLLAARESGEDPGRKIPEARKRDRRGLVAANFRRAEEALRVLEEYGKVLSPEAAGRFKKVRFALYSFEKGSLENEN